MLSVSATLAWAMPVPAETLGAHVEAYVNLLPTITTLRLCHRFATTSSVAKLPVELLCHIEELLTQDERTKNLAAWTTNFRCMQLLCEPEDHLTEEALDKLTDDIVHGKLEEEDDDVSEWDLEARVSMYLDRHDETWIDEHYSRQSKFEATAGFKTCRPVQDGVFGKNAELLRKLLGLDIWTTYVRLREPPADNRWSWIGPDFWPAETFIAYLVLPGTVEQNKRYWPTEVEEDEKEVANEDGCAMQVVPPKLVKGSRKRFKRALQMLDLKPKLHPSQAGNILGDPSSARESSWPRLTMLVSSGHNTYV